MDSVLACPHWPPSTEASHVHPVGGSTLLSLRREPQRTSRSSPPWMMGSSRSGSRYRNRTSAPPPRLCSRACTRGWFKSDSGNSLTARAMPTHISPLLIPVSETHLPPHITDVETLGGVAVNLREWQCRPASQRKAAA